MMHLSLSIIISLVLDTLVSAFISQYCPLSLRHRLEHHTILLLSKDNGIFEAALTELSWEKFEKQDERAVLNLSERESSPEDLKPEDTSDWDKGQRWLKTAEKLNELFWSEESEQQQNREQGVDFMLSKCPQLYRLKTEQIMETAMWLIEEFDNIDYILQEPRLLLYKCEDVKYGLQFLNTMMMMSTIGTDKSKKRILIPPALLLTGIDGGIQERVVKRTLGAAGDATYAAKKEIAVDAATTLKALKNKGPKL